MLWYSRFSFYQMLHPSSEYLCQKSSFNNAKEFLWKWHTHSIIESFSYFLWLTYLGKSLHQNQFRPFMSPADARILFILPMFSIIVASFTWRINWTWIPWTWKRFRFPNVSSISSSCFLIFYKQHHLL